MKTTFINISNKTIAQLLEDRGATCMWAVDKLPPNQSPERNLLVATADKGDTLNDIIQKWLLQMGVKPHRESIKRERQLINLMQENIKKIIETVLIIENAENLNKPQFDKFHKVSEVYDCPIIIQGDLLRFGVYMTESQDFIQRAYIGVHAQDF